MGGGGALEGGFREGRMGGGGGGLREGRLGGGSRWGDLGCWGFFAAHPFVTPPFPMLHGAVGHGHCVCAYNPRSCFTFSTNQPCTVQTPAFKVGRMPMQSSFEIPPQADGAHRTNTRTGPLHLLIVATAYRSRECQKC